MIPKETKQDFADAFSEINTYQKVLNLTPKLNEPILYLKDTGIASRVLSHWKNNDLLSGNRESDKGWSRFNFIDYIWLKSIQEMRNFGLSLETIKKVKKALYEKLNIKWDEDTVKEVVEYGIKTIKNSAMDKVSKEMLIQVILNPEFKTQFKDQVVNPSVLDGLIMNSLFNQEEAGFFIFGDGDILPWLDSKHNDIESESLFKRSHLYISITEFIFEFITEEAKEQFLVPYLMVGKKELEALRRIRKDDLKEIIIKFPKGSNKEDMDIITKKKVKLTEEQQKSLRQMLRLKNYQTIVIKNQGEKDLYVEKDHREKITS